jgi:hypothetical protein
LLNTEPEITVILDEGGVGFKIESIWAFLATHPDDQDEGIVALMTPNGGAMPAIAADQERLDLLRPRMRQLAEAMPNRIKLVRFDHRTDMETL